MTLPAIGTTQGAQSANTSVAAEASATGAITFVGPSGISGATITCTVTIPLAPTSAIFTATLGTPNGMGVPVGTWSGPSTAGRFQIGIGQTLVVTGTGLPAAMGVACTFAQVIDIGSVQPVTPEPNTFTSTPAPTSIASGSFETFITTSVQVLPPTPGTTWTLFNLSLNVTAAPFPGTLYQDPTGAVPPAAGETLYTYPAATGPYNSSFAGFALNPGNGLYLTSGGSSPSFPNEGAYQLSYA